MFSLAGMMPATIGGDRVADAAAIRQTDRLFF